VKYWNIAPESRWCYWSVTRKDREKKKTFDAKLFIAYNFWSVLSWSIRSMIICVNLFAESSSSDERRGRNNEKIRRHITGASSNGKQYKFVFLEYQWWRRVIAPEEQKLLYARECRGSSRYTNRTLSVQLHHGTCHGDEDRIYADRDWPVNCTLSATVVLVLQYCCRIEESLIIYDPVVCRILRWILLPSF